MTDVVKFLTARYDEAEKRERGRGTFKGWPTGNPCPECGRPTADVIVRQSGTDDAEVEFDPCGDVMAGDEFFKRYGQSAADPFVLADIEAKRELLELHPHTTMRQDAGEARLRLNYGPHWEKRLKHVDDLYCLRCHVDDGMIHGDDGRHCLHLRLLASPYAGRTDFLEVWRV